MEGFDELLACIEQMTGLNPRACQAIALQLARDNDPGRSGLDFSAGEVARAAQGLGYDLPDELRQLAQQDPNPLGRDITLDEAQVLSEVYMVAPRVMCQQMPKLGRAPEELRKLAPELVEQLPEEVRAMLVKIDVFEGKATFWLYDEANEIDRPIGPIDVSRYADGQQLHEAFADLVRRLPKVLSSDFN